MATRLTKEYLTIQEAIATYPIGRSKLYELIRDGHVKGFNVGRRRAVLASSIEDYFQQLLRDQNPDT